MSKKLDLLELLIQNVKEEVEYTKWYNEREMELKSNETTMELYSFYISNRNPNKTTIKESLKMIGRLGFQLAKEDIL